MALRVLRCGIHGFHETLGIDTDEIRLHWTLGSDDEDATQTAYRITLSTCAADLSTAEQASNEKLEWDTGIVKSDVQRDILCKLDSGFRSTCTYYWQVIVFDHNGVASSSAVQSFFTAYPRSNLLPPYSMNQTYVNNASR